MAEGIEEATAAFQAAISPTAKPAPAAKSAAEAKPERMFEKGGELVDSGDGDVQDSTGEEEEDEIRDGPRTPEGDEGPDEEEDGDPDQDDGEGEEEDGEESDELLDTVIEVTIDGKPAEVTVKEAAAGYIRQQTFHQRMNKLNEVQTVMQQEIANIDQTRTEWAGKVQEVEELLGSLLPKEPDWDRLYAEDPKAARELQKQYEQINQKVSDLKAKRQEAAVKAAEEHRNRTATYARDEFSKWVGVNRFSSRKDVEKELTSMKQTARQEGFSDEEVATVYDSRMLRILQKASKYDRMMAARPRPINKGGKRTVAPGAGNGKTRRTAPKGIDRAQKDHARVGSVESAAKVFEKFLG